MSKSPLVGARALEVFLKIAGLACRIHAFLVHGTGGCPGADRQDLDGEGGCRVTRAGVRGPLSPMARSGPWHPPSPAFWVGDTPARIRGDHHLRRYGWSWPEPLAGATPHQAPEPPSPGQDRGLRAAGVTNG